RGRCEDPFDWVSARHSDFAGVRREQQHDNFAAQRDDHHAVLDFDDAPGENLHCEFVHFAVPVKGSYERSIDKAREWIQPAGNDDRSGAGHADAGRGGATLHPSGGRHLDGFAAGGVAAGFSGRLRHADQGPEPGRRGPGPRRADPPALQHRYSGVRLRSNEVLPRRQQHQPGDVSLAGCNANSLRAHPGIHSRADAFEQPKRHRCGHGGVLGHDVLLELLPGDRVSFGVRDLWAGHRTGAGGVPIFPPTICWPGGGAPRQAVNDTMVGLTPGDLVLMTLNGTQVVGEVTAGTITTGTNAVGTTYIVPFANSDALNMNQTAAGATAGLNGGALNATGATPVRLLAITYYIDNTVSPARLMRQISGHTPMPVADGLAYMKFSYDLYNDTTNTPAVNQPNPGSGDANDTASNSLNPTDITKINILHMAMNSTL